MDKKLEYYCESIVDSEHKTAPTQEFGIPYIRTPNVVKGRLNLESAKKVSEETYREWTKRLEPKPGDLILTREAPVGEIGIIPKNCRVCLGQRTVLIRPNKSKLNSFFLLYLFQTKSFLHSLSSKSGGTIVGHLNMREIRDLELLDLPEIDIQQRIGSTLSNFDSQIINLETQNKILEKIIQSIFKSWFIDFDGQAEFVDSELGEIPKGWKVKSIGEVIELVYGKSLTKNIRISGNIPVYGSSGIVGYHNRALSQGPGIIVGRKGNVGSIFWTQNPFYAIDTVYYVKTNIPLHYVYHNFQNQNFINSDSSVPGLQRDQAYGLPMLIPDKSILIKFEEYASCFRENITSNELKIYYLTKIRDSLLPKLMSGEIKI